MIEITTKTRIRLSDDKPPMETAKNPGDIASAIKFLDRIDDREIVKAALKRRFATGLVKTAGKRPTV